MTNAETITTQAYIFPIPDGWGVECHGYSDMPNREVLPLPYTDRAIYADVVAGFARTPAGRQARIIDGWETLAEFRACEPELCEQVWGPARRSL